MSIKAIVKVYFYTRGLDFNIDAWHIELFYRKELCSNSKKYVYENIVHYHVDSEHLIKDLKVHGVFRQKHLPSKLRQLSQKNISTILYEDIFDGDGCVTTGPSIEFIGTSSLLLWIQEHLLDTWKLHPISKDARVKCFWIGGRNKVTKVYKFLYKNATIYLPRKKKRFEELLGLSKTHKS